MPKVARIEKKIRDVEGFDIVIMKDGRNVRSDKDIPKQYSAEKKSKDAFTVANWSAKFQSQFPGYDVQVLYADGSVAKGQTLLSTVRDTYNRNE